MSAIVKSIIIQNMSMNYSKNIRFITSIIACLILITYIIIEIISNGGIDVSQTFSISIFISLSGLMIMKKGDLKSSKNSIRYGYLLIALIFLLIILLGYSVYSNNIIGIRNSLGGLIFNVFLYIMNRKTLKVINTKKD